MKHQVTNNTATTNNGNLTPCSRVFAIPELLEQIAHHLDFDTLENGTKLGLVCHLWHSVLEQYIWRSVMLKDNAKKRVRIVQLHGNLIRHLRCHRVDKSLLRSIARHTPSLETIHLTFDKHSLWATPDHLGEIFFRLQDRLVSVSLLFDSYTIDSKWLENLKLLKGITKLVLTASEYTENQVHICAQVLDCCPGLKDFELTCKDVPVDYEIASGREGGGALNRWWTGVQKGVVSVVDKLPTIGRQQAAALAPVPPPIGLSSQSSSVATSTSTTSLATSVVKRTADSRRKRQIIDSFCGMYLHNSLRRFKLSNHAYDPIYFTCFTQHCLNLKEIDMHCARARIEPYHWIRFASACPRLRSLRAHFCSTKYDLGDQKHVLALFPQLELLSASIGGLMHWSDWKATVIDDCLATHSQDHLSRSTTPLALRTLHLRSYFGTLENLLEILSINSPLLALDTLVVGFLKEFREYSENATFPGKPEPYIRRKYGSIFYHLNMTEMPWNAVLKVSLTRLDISAMILADQTVVRIMFRRFQELENLRAFSVSALHLHYWMSSTFSFTMPTFTTLTSLPSNITNTTIPDNYASSTVSTHYHDDLVHLPKVEYHLPSIQDLIVEPFITHIRAPRKWMTVDETVHALAAMPGLEYFCPRGECMEDETLKALRRVFPRQFMTIPEERLDWLV
ncbi:hypothetical protein K457DRAFT_897341 [Linnemannia elongata AG-77]|uniref:F-box domain-containing protein n=1 Tax=Linnemannia elongata AG-77 TaxID=1314771 RepID=A0A197JU99_9FUNG|nr:hypothetical protein K457DRAFT_897341 [Linnemannia elongata AG-77]